MQFANARPELVQSLLGGDEKIKERLRGSARQVPAGQVLIHAGSDHGYVHRLVSGWACRTRRSLDDRQQFILMFLPGELFGIKSMFVSRQCDEVAILTDSVVESIPHRHLHDSFVNDPDIAHRCAWQIVEEERRLHVWVFALAKARAEERLAWALLDFRSRMVATNFIHHKSGVYPMPLTQGELACYLGCTPVHMNRVLQRFRREDIVHIEHGQVRIQQADRLADFAFPLDDDRRPWAPGNASNQRL